MIIKITHDDWGRIAIITQAKPRARKNIIASGFKTIQAAIDYARLKFYDIDLKDDFAFTESQKTAIQNIAAEVCNQYCSWGLFVENICSYKNGLQEFLQMIAENKSPREIVNNYI